MDRIYFLEDNSGSELITNIQLIKDLESYSFFQHIQCQLSDLMKELIELNKIKVFSKEKKIKEYNNYFGIQLSKRKKIEKCHILSNIKYIKQGLESFQIPRKDNFIDVIKNVYFTKTYKNLDERNIPLAIWKKKFFEIMNDGIKREEKLFFCPDKVKRDLQESIDIVCKSYCELYGKVNFKFSKFQANGINEVLISKFFKSKTNDELPRNFIITGEVGIGKTLIFLFPILIEIIFFKNGDILKETKFSTIIFTPRVSLTKSHYEMIESIIKIINKHTNSEIKVLLDAGGELVKIVKKDYSNSISNVKKAVKAAYNDSKYDIVLTNFETFKNRIHNPFFSNTLCKMITNIVIDEIHLLTGRQGTHMHFIFKRLRGMINYIKKTPPKLTLFGISATILNPKEHFMTILSIPNFSRIIHIFPNKKKFNKDGLKYHFFIEKREDISFHKLDLLFTLSYFLIINRRSELNLLINNGLNQNEINQFQRSIIFIDSKQDINTLDKKFKDNRYIKKILVFINPLLYSRIYRNSKNDEFVKLCRKCKNNEKWEIKISLQENSDILKIFDLKVGNKYIQLPNILCSNYVSSKNEKKFLKIGNLIECPYYKTKKCYFFNNELKEPKNYFQSNEKRIKSKSFSADDELVSFNNLYTDDYTNQFPNSQDINYLGTKICIDLLITTPAIEVGVNIPNLNEGLGMKFIRDYSSYHQKVGRVGRSSNNDSVFITLLNKGKIENQFGYKYTQNSVHLITPVYTSVKNENYEKIHIFSSIFDYFSINQDFEFYNIDNTKFSFSNRINVVYEDLKMRRDLYHDLYNYLADIFDHDYISDTLDNFIHHLYNIIKNTYMGYNFAKFLELNQKNFPLSKKPKLFQSYEEYLKENHSFKNIVSLFRNLDYFKLNSPFYLPKNYFLKKKMSSIYIKRFEQKDLQIKWEKPIEADNFEKIIQYHLPGMLVKKKKSNYISISANFILNSFQIKSNEFRISKYYSINLEETSTKSDKEYENNLFNKIEINSLDIPKFINHDLHKEKIFLYQPKSILLQKISSNSLKIDDNALVFNKNIDKFRKNDYNFQNFDYNSIYEKSIIKIYLNKRDLSCSIFNHSRGYLHKILTKLEFIKPVDIVECAFGYLRSLYSKTIPIFFIQDQNNLSIAPIGRKYSTNCVRIYFNDRNITKFIEFYKKSHPFDLIALYNLILDLLHTEYPIIGNKDKISNNIILTIVKNMLKFNDNNFNFNYNRLYLQVSKYELENDSLSELDLKIRNIIVQKILNFDNQKLEKLYTNYLEKSIKLSFLSTFIQSLQELFGFESNDLKIKYEKRSKSFYIYENEVFGNGVLNFIIKNNELINKKLIKEILIYKKHKKDRIEEFLKVSKYNLSEIPLSNKKNGTSLKKIHFLSKILKSGVSINNFDLSVLDKINFNGLCIYNCLKCLYNPFITKNNEFSLYLLDFLLFNNFLSWVDKL